MNKKQLRLIHSFTPLVLAAVFLAGVCATTLQSAPKNKAKKPQPPNVILISIDTLRADHLGCYGYDKNTTPALDAFAKEAWLFENAFSTSTYTLPAHMAMHTGVMPPIQSPSDVRFGIHSALPTLTKLFKKAGYRTGGWADFMFLAPKYGFDKKWTIYDDEGAARILPEALEWIGQPKKPFFLFLHMFDPHIPYKADARFQFRFKTPPTSRGRRMMLAHDTVNVKRPLRDFESIEAAIDAYDAEIYGVDDELSIFFAGLKESGLWDNTLILVTSDHGESFLDHGIRFGHGLFMYDEVIHIPFLLKPPGEVRPRRIRQGVSMLDIFPTVLDAAGIDVPKRSQGIALMPRVREGSIPNRSLVTRSTNIGGSLALRFGKWKWIEAPRLTRMVLKARIAGKNDLLTDSMEYTGHEEPSKNVDLPEDFWPQNSIGRFIEGNIPQSDHLFNIALDPGEKNNLWEENPEAAARGKSKALAIRHEWQTLLDELNQIQTKKKKAPEISEEEKERLRSLGYLN